MNHALPLLSLVACPALFTTPSCSKSYFSSFSNEPMQSYHIACPSQLLFTKETWMIREPINTVVRLILGVNIAFNKGRQTPHALNLENFERPSDACLPPIYKKELHFLLLVLHTSRNSGWGNADVWSLSIPCSAAPHPHLDTCPRWHTNTFGSLKQSSIAAEVRQLPSRQRTFLTLWHYEKRAYSLVK